MNRIQWSVVGVLVGLALLIFTGDGKAVTARAAEDIALNFEDHVGKVLRRHCATCHGDAKQEAGLSLASFAAVMKGGSGGEVVVAGRSSASRLLQVLIAEDPAERMPPKSDPLPADQIAIVQRWIDEGLRETVGSAAMKSRGVAFRPATDNDATGNSALDDGPIPWPHQLPAIELPSTRRAFPRQSLAASPRGQLIAAAAYGGVEFFDSEQQTTLGAVAFPAGEPQVLKFSRRGDVLLVAGGRPVQEGVVSLYDVSTGQSLGTLGQEADIVLAADLSPDNALVVMGGPSRIVKLVATASGDVVHQLVKHTDWITAVAFSPDGKTLATGDRGGNIHLWDVAAGGLTLSLSEHKGLVRALSWRSDSRVLVSAGEDGRIVWWNVSEGWPAASQAEAHPSPRPAGYTGKLSAGVLDAAHFADGRVATVGRDQSLKIWSDSGQLLKVLPFPAMDTSVSVHPLVKTLLKAGTTGGESVVKTPTGAALVGSAFLPTRVAVIAASGAVAAGDTAGRLHVWPAELLK